MKVNIDKTEQVDDVQRVQIANVLDQKVSKRQATRDEMKGFLWAHGASWPQDLLLQHAELTGEEPDPVSITEAANTEGGLSESELDVDMGELDDLL